MRNRHILVAIFAILAILLSGCSKKKQGISDLMIDNMEDDTEYEYINIMDNKLFDIIDQVDVTAEGLILVRAFIETNEEIYGEIDDDTYDSKLLLFNSNGEYIREIHMDGILDIYTLDSNDNIYIINTDLSKDSRCLQIFNLEGDKIFESDRIEGDNLDSIKKIRTYDDNLIYLLKKSGEIEIVDENLVTKGMVRIGNSKIVDFDINNKNDLIILAEEDGNYKIIIYDTKNKREVYANEIDANLYFYKIKYDGIKNKIYGIGGSSVWEIESNGIVGGKILDSKANLILMEIRDVFTIEEDYYIFAYNSENLMSGIFRRQLVDKGTLASQKEITIAIYGINTFVFKDAIELFKSLNPDTEILLVEKGDLSYEQFMQVINTEIMAGKGPDLFYGHFPYESYLDKNILLDLGEYIDYDDEKYYNNILEGSKYQGKQYLFPISFNFPKMFLNRKILKEKNIELNYENLTVEELSEIVDMACVDKGNTNYFSFKAYGAKSLLGEIIDANIDTFIDYDKKEVNFNNIEFKNLLKEFKNISSKEKPDISNNTMNFNLDDSVLFEINNYYGYNSYSAMLNLGDKASNYIMMDIPIFEGGTNAKVFTAEFCGINKNTKNKELALTFLEFLSSEGYGIKYNSDGFHINKEAGKWDRELYSTGNVEPYKDIHKKFGISPRSLNEEDLLTLAELDKFEQMINSLNSHNFNYLPIFDEISFYFDDKQDLDTTITNIQNKMELVIGE